MDRLTQNTYDRMDARIAQIANGLRALADEIDHERNGLTRYKGTSAQAQGAAQTIYSVQHAIAWGVANLNADMLTSNLGDLYEAEQTAG